MLTQEQRDTFRLAVALDNAGGDESIADIDDIVGSDSRVVETAETMDDFFKARGRTVNRKGEDRGWCETVKGRFYRWDNVQARPGCRRGTLYVMDFGDARAAYFDGES